MVIFIVWIVFIPLEQKKLECHEKLSENKDFCYVVMPSKDTKASFIIYPDFECLIENIDGCKIILKIHLQ